MKKVALLIAAALLGAMLLASCTAGPSETTGKPDMYGDLAGFWVGLWHGFIAVFSFIISLFNDNVTVYEVHNNGHLYDLGFLLGVAAFFGGSGKASN